MSLALTTTMTVRVHGPTAKRTAVLMWTILAAASLLGVACVARAAVPATPGFQANFVEIRTLPGFDTPLVMHGRVHFDPAGFRWEVTAPYHYLFEMHGEQAEEQLPDGQRRKLDATQIPWLVAVKQLLASALSANQAELQKYFEVQVTPEPKGQHVALTPKPGALAQAIQRIEVTESAPGHPEQLVIRETGGGRLTIRFSPATP